MIRVKAAIIICLLFSGLGLASAEYDQNIPFSGLQYPIEIRLNSDTKFGATAYETPYSAPAASAFDTVYVQGVMPDAAARLDLAVTNAAGEKSYRYAAMHRFPNGRFWAKYLLPGTDTYQVRFVLVSLGLRGASTLTIYEAEEEASATRQDAVIQATFTYVADPALSVPENAPFTLIRRAQWKALPPRAAFDKHTPRFFTMHHTASHYPKTLAESVAEIQFIQDFHQSGRGWNDIGYHFLIDPLGNIFEGRPIGVIGAHVKNRNTGNVGISIMGNYQAPVSNKITQATINSFVAVGTYLKNNYAVERSSYFAHRDIQAGTDCPGNDLYAIKETLRGLIFDPVAVVPVPVTPPAAGQELTPAQSKSLAQLMDMLK